GGWTCHRAGRPGTPGRRWVSAGVGQDVRLDLVAVGQLVHQVEEPHHRQHLAEPLVVQPEPLHGGGVAVDSVASSVHLDAILLKTGRFPWVSDPETGRHSLQTQVKPGLLRNSPRNTVGYSPPGPDLPAAQA